MLQIYSQKKAILKSIWFGLIGVLATCLVATIIGLIIRYCSPDSNIVQILTPIIIVPLYFIIISAEAYYNETYKNRCTAQNLINKLLDGIERKEVLTKTQQNNHYYIFAHKGFLYGLSVEEESKKVRGMYKRNKFLYFWVTYQCPSGTDENELLREMKKYLENKKDGHFISPEISRSIVKISIQAANNPLIQEYMGIYTYLIKRFNLNPSNETR